MNEFTIVLKSKTNVVRYNYEHKLHAFIYSLLDDKDSPNKSYGNHDKSFIHSNLMESEPNAKRPCGIWTKNGIEFKSNPQFHIRTEDCSVIRRLADNLKRGIKAFDDFVVYERMYDYIENVGNYSHFMTMYSSPIIISKMYSYFKDAIPQEKYKDVQDYLETNVRDLAAEKGVSLDFDGFSIKIEKEYKPCDISPKQCGISNFQKAYKEKGRNFKLEITGTAEVKDFIMKYGIGRSKSLGCGYIFIDNSNN